MSRRKIKRSAKHTPKPRGKHAENREVVKKRHAEHVIRSHRRAMNAAPAYVQDTVGKKEDLEKLSMQSISAADQPEDSSFAGTVENFVSVLEGMEEDDQHEQGTLRTV